MEVVESKKNQTNFLLQQKEWMEENFKQDKLVCVMGNKASHVCIDEKCKDKNVFLCYKQCKCGQDHKNCCSKKLQSVLKSIGNQKSLRSILKQHIDEMMEGLIDVLSQKKESIKTRIEKGQANECFQQSQQIRRKNFEILLKKTISGSTIAKFIKLKEENLQQPKFQLLKQELKTIFQEQKNEKMKEFFLKVQGMFDQMAKTGWDSQLKPQNLKINRNHVSLNLQSYRNHVSVDLQSQNILMCLLSPSITTMIGKIIKWRIKIKSIGKLSCISLGIGLRQSLKKKNFISKPQENNQCYLICSNSLVYAAKDSLLNKSNQFGISFMDGDIIEMQYNKQKWILKFKNERTKQSGELEIKQIPNPQKDQYHICVGLISSGDKIEILQPIETSLKTYWLGNYYH